MKFVDISGKKYGRLLVLNREPNIGIRVAWKCMCDCGKNIVIPGIHFKYGNTRSCGCLRSEWMHNTFVKHGCAAKGKTYEYKIWLGIKTRCRSRNKNYSGRGISLCKRWESFTNFFNDMGPRPSTNYSIDRIDNNGNYEPLNCRWTTDAVQAGNKRNNKRITIGGETKILAEWCRIFGRSHSTIGARIRRGIGPEKAFSY